MVRRKKTTIFLDAKESSTVMDLKKMIEGITKKAPADQQLFNKDDQGMDLYFSISPINTSPSIHLRSHHAPFPINVLGLKVFFQILNL